MGFTRYLKCFFVSIQFFLFFNAFGQEIIATLPAELAESSALCKIGDDFITINDSGNSPIVYIFDDNGKIKHRCNIKNANNSDWEALVYDGFKFLYIGDIGNNNNKRKDLCVYRVVMHEVLTKKEVIAEKFSFYYPEQLKFPPSQNELYYDAEAMILKDDELLVLTKNRTVPFDGISKIYGISLNSGKNAAVFKGEINLPATNWLENSVVDAGFYKNKLYLLTYSKLYVFKFTNNKWQEEQSIRLDTITQKEGLAVDDEFIYFTDEDNPVFSNGNFLYRMSRNLLSE